MSNSVPNLQGDKTKTRSQFKIKERNTGQDRKRNPSQQSFGFQTSRRKHTSNMNPYQLKSVCLSDQKLCVSNELSRGRQAVNDLMGLIRHQNDLSSANADGLQPAFGLMTRIIDSFSNSLSMLSSQDPAITGGSRASNKTLSITNGGKMCHEQRKGDSWTQVTSDGTADGCAWRKYGQKPILNAKHPRSYYKCRNKPHCQALKRVQKTDDEPPLYKITHIGHHTCEKHYSSQSFRDMDSSVLFNFQKEDDEQSNKGVKGNQQSGLISNNLPLLEHIETTKNVQWSLDDYDYLIGSVEFNDLHAF